MPHKSIPSSSRPPAHEWGHHYWYVMRLTALQAGPFLSAPQRADLKNLFVSLRTALPCEVCQKHYRKLLSTHPITDDHLRDATKLAGWVEMIRGLVEKSKAEGGPATKGHGHNHSHSHGGHGHDHGHNHRRSPARGRRGSPRGTGAGYGGTSDSLDYIVKTEETRHHSTHLTRGRRVRGGAGTGAGAGATGRSRGRGSDDIWKKALVEQKTEQRMAAEKVRMRSNAERAMVHHRRRKYPECCH